MSYTDVDNPMYYPEDYDYSIYYQDELRKYQSPNFVTSNREPTIRKSGILPAIRYLNERKCPIYVHHIRKDSSVYNHYNEKLITPKKSLEKHNQQKSTPQNASKFVLDKLEETYWATWKPKKENVPRNRLKTPRKLPDFGFSNLKPVFQEHNKVTIKESQNKPHGDINDSIIKYFKAQHFDSSSNTDYAIKETNRHKSNTLLQKKSESTKTLKIEVSKSTKAISNDVESKKSKKLERPSNTRRNTITKKESVSQEIQTEVQCPIILEDTKETISTKEEIGFFAENDETHNESGNTSEHLDKAKQKKAQSKFPNGKGKTKTKKGKEPKTQITNKISNTPLITGTEDNTDSISTFLEHKDSIIITKKKQEKTGSKEHFQQPKCIRLYRKSGLAAGYIKGGSYPLKSCLKKEGSPKGNFRLGAPGSPLFVTTSSFVNKRRK